MMTAKHEKQTILIVDDEPTNITILAQILSGHYHIKMAKTGEKALFLAQQQPDLILLDIVMPDMDGYEVCRTLKEQASTREIPVIFITAKDASEEETFGLHLGAADYIIKPFILPIVKARVDAQLQLKRQSDELKQLHREALHKQEVFRAVADLSTELSYYCDIEGNYIYITPYCHTLTGYGVNDFYKIPNLLAHLIYPDDLLHWKQYLHTISLNGETQQAPSEIEIRILHKNGDVRWVTFNSTCVKCAKDEIIGYRGSCIDITERKAFIADLEQAHNKVQQAQTELQHLNTELEQRVIQRTSELAQANTEITLLNNRLKAENLRLETELDVAQRLQEMVLPRKKELSQVEGLAISAFMLPATEVGGDYYDVLHYNNSLTIGIGDVTGHGLESGVLMLMVQTAIRTLLVNGHMCFNNLLQILNNIIYDNLQRMVLDKSLTLLLLNYEYESDTFQLTGQHEEVLVVRRHGEVERVDTFDLGFVIGLDDDISEFIQKTPIKLNNGDGIVLYTDGITEALNDQKELYGLERLCDVVSHHWHQSNQTIENAVINDVKQYAGTREIDDDMTLVIIKKTHDTPYFNPTNKSY